MILFLKALEVIRFLGAPFPSYGIAVVT